MSDLSEQLEVFITNTASGSRLHVGGEIDLATVDTLREHLALLVETGTGDIDVDMAGVDFCGATALRVLLSARQTLDAAGRHIQIVNPSLRTLRLLQLTGLDTILLAPSRRDRQHRSHLPKRSCRGSYTPAIGDGHPQDERPL